MHDRPLGITGIRISAVSFGAGPVPALLTKSDTGERQIATLRRALDAGINWIDTAPTYGEGQSEASLGKSLAALGSPDIHVATKVRFTDEGLQDIRAWVQSSFEASLARLNRQRVTLLQLHNSITARRGDQPTSITPDDVLGPGGVAEAFAELRQEGRVLHLGLTGLGDVPSLFEVVRSRAFETIQVPYHVLNPSAGSTLVPADAEASYGNIIGECEHLGMGVLAIRVFAGGALAGQPPSAHTRTTKFFPLAIYERDQSRAAELARRMAAEPGLSGMPLKELALRFALSHRGVSSALIGISSPEQIDEALEYANRGPLDPEVCIRLANLVQ
ncbi:MAG: aldo/keto reductase [Planctomycetia bacterium]|nr:aldo/keto reductase [Planctomycetia bacterium]